MRQQPAKRSDDDERRFDVRLLEPGDAVELFDEPEQRWMRGTYRITTAGEAQIEVRYGHVVDFDDALVAGLRRVLQ